MSIRGTKFANKSCTYPTTTLCHGDCGPPVNKPTALAALRADLLDHRLGPQPTSVVVIQDGEAQPSMENIPCIPAKGLYSCICCCLALVAVFCTSGFRDNDRLGSGTCPTQAPLTLNNSILRILKKSSGDEGVMTGTGEGCHWQALVTTSHRGGLDVMVVLSLSRSNSDARILFKTTEQPYIGKALLSPIRGRVDKSTPKKACSIMLLSADRS